MRDELERACRAYLEREYTDPAIRERLLGELTRDDALERVMRRAAAAARRRLNKQQPPPQQHSHGRELSLGSGHSIDPGPPQWDNLLSSRNGDEKAAAKGRPP